jgi:hypothetical protein
MPTNSIFVIDRITHLPIQIHNILIIGLSTLTSILGMICPNKTYFP